MSPLVPRPVSLTVAAAAALAALTVAAGTALALDPSFGIVMDRPLLVTRTADLHFELRGPGGKIPVGYSEETVFVDEHTRLSDKEEKATRKYVRSEATSAGDTADPPFAGLVCEYTREGKDVGVRLLGDRILPSEHLDRLLGEFDAIGLSIPLPSSVEHDQEFDLDLIGLAQVLGMNGHTLKKARGKFRLTSSDPVDERHVFEGNAEIVEESFLDGFQTTTTLRGPCKFTTSRKEKRILSVEYDAELALDLEEYGVEGKGRATIRVTTELGKAAEAALKKKGKFRTNIVRARGLGVGMKLSSSYAPLPMDYPEHAWVRTLDGDKGQARITLELVEGDNSNPSYTFDKIEASLRKEYPGLIAREARCPIGKGRAYFIPPDSTDENLFQSELYPLPGKNFLLVKLFGPPKAYQAAVADFEKAKSSLGMLEK